MDANEEIVRRHWKRVAFDGDPLYGYELRLGDNATYLVPRYHEVKAKSQAGLWAEAREYTEQLRQQISELEEEIEFLLDLPVSGEIMSRLIDRSRKALAKLQAFMS